MGESMTRRRHRPGWSLETALVMLSRGCCLLAAVWTSVLSYVLTRVMRRRHNACPMRTPQSCELPASARDARGLSRSRLEVRPKDPAAGMSACFSDACHEAKGPHRRCRWRR